MRRRGRRAAVGWQGCASCSNLRLLSCETCCESWTCIIYHAHAVMLWVMEHRVVEILKYENDTNVVHVLGVRAATHDEARPRGTRCRSLTFSLASALFSVSYLMAMCTPTRHTTLSCRLEKECESRDPDPVPPTALASPSFAPGPACTCNATSKLHPQRDPRPVDSWMPARVPAHQSI